MSEVSALLVATAERLFAAECSSAVLARAEQGEWPAVLWRAVSEAGLPGAMLPEAAGGAGTTMRDGFALLRVAAGFSAPIPLAETMLAGWLFAGAGLAVPDGALSVAPVRRQDRFTLVRRGAGWHLTGSAARIPWARAASAIAVLAEAEDGPMLVRLDPRAAAITPAANLAAEPRDTITVDTDIAAEAAAPARIDPDTLRVMGAALRTSQIAGATASLLEISVRYAQTRVQFGRPIGKFQAVQHNIARLAGAAAAAAAAADMAAEVAKAGAAGAGPDPVIIGAAKARAGEAAGEAAALAHQVHGAIGFTQEYELHYATRRLWSWRDEFGNEAEWNRVVGRAAAAAGADGLWAAITAA